MVRTGVAKSLAGDGVGCSEQTAVSYVERGDGNGVFRSLEIVASVYRPVQARSVGFTHPNLHISHEPSTHILEIDNSEFINWYSRTV